MYFSLEEIAISDLHLTTKSHIASFIIVLRYLEWR